MQNWTLAGGNELCIYDVGLGAWPARPRTNGPVLYIGPSPAPASRRPGDGFQSTDAIPNLGGGSFEKVIGIARGFPSPESTTSSQAVTADRSVFMRVKGAVAGATGIGVAVAVTSGGLMGLAVHANSGVGDAAIPGPRKCTTGAVAIPANNTQTKIPFVEGATDVNEGDWIQFVCNEATTARFFRNSTLYPVTSMMTGLCYAQNSVINGVPTLNPSGVFLSTASWAVKVFQ